MSKLLEQIKSLIPSLVKEKYQNLAYKYIAERDFESLYELTEAVIAEFTRKVDNSDISDTMDELQRLKTLVSEYATLDGTPIDGEEQDEEDYDVIDELIYEEEG